MAKKPGVNDQKNTFLNIWTETTASRKSHEISSSCYQFFKGNIDKDKLLETLCVSDNTCGGKIETLSLLAFS